MADESAQGFFNFGNNAEENANQIIQQYERIQRALDNPLILNDRTIAADIAQVEEGLAKLQGVAEERTAAIRRAFEEFGNGQIQFPDLKAAIREQVQGAAREVPTLIAQEFGKLDPKAFARQNLSEIAGTATHSITDYLNDYVRSLRSTVEGLGSRALKVDTTGIAEQNRLDPLNYSALSDVQAARIRVQAEELAKAQFYNKPTTAGQHPMDVAQRLGITDQVNAVLDAQSGKTFVGTGAADELKEATARLTAAIKADADAELEAAAAAKERARAANLNVLGASPYAEQFKSGHALGDQFYSRQGDLLSETEDEAKINSIITERNAMRDQEFERINRNGEAAAVQARKEQESNGTVLGGAVGRLDKRGGLANNIGEQLIQAFDYTIGYALLFGALAELKDTVGEFVQYQTAVVDLNIAMGEGSAVTQSYVSDLGELSRVAGSNVAEAAQAATQGIYALSDAQASDAQKRRAGLGVATAASQLSVVANKPLQDATGDILATATGFGIKSNNLNSIVDAVASAKRNVGGDAAQISQGLANLAVVAKQAGFTLGQTADIIGLVQSRTDESGSTVASRLTRILQTLNGSTGQQLAQNLRSQLAVYKDSTGAPTTSQSSAADQLSAYAKIYSDRSTDSGTKDLIASSLGGIASLRELLPLLTQADVLQRAYTASQHSAGEGLDEYQKKTDTFAGTLKKLQGDLSNIQVDFAKSGVLDAFGGAIKVLEPALYTLDAFLQTFQKLPASIRPVVGLLIDVAIASKAIAAVSAARAARAAAEGTVVGGRAAAAGTTVATGAQAELVAAQAAQSAAAERQIAYASALARASNTAALAEEREAAAAEAKAIALDAAAAASARETVAAEANAVANTEAAAVGLVGGLTRLMAFLANPATLAVIGAIGVAAAVGVNLENDHIQRVVQQNYQDSARSYGLVDGTSGSLASAAGALRGTASTMEDTKFKSYLGGIIGGESLGTRATNKADEASLTDSARGLYYLSQQVAQEERLAAASKNLSVFGNGAITTVNQLAEGLNTISQSGGSALTQYNALVKALTTPPKPGQALFQPVELSSQIIAALGRAAADKRVVPDGVDAGTRVTYLGGKSVIVPTDPRGTGTYYGRAEASPVDPTTVIPRGKDQTAALLNFLQGDIKRLGLDKQTSIGPKALGQLTRDAAQQLDLSGVLQGAPEYRQAIIKNALKSLSGKALYDPTSPLGALNGKTLSDTQISDILNQGPKNKDGTQYPGLVAAFQAAQQAVPESDDGSGALRLLKTQRDTLSAIMKKGIAGGVDPAALEQINVLLSNAKHDYAQLAISQLDDLRKAAESRTYDPVAQAAVRLRFAKLQVAKAGNDVPLLRGIFSNLDKQTVDGVLAYERQVRETQRATLEASKKLLADTLSALGADIGKGSNVVATAQAGVAAAHAALDATNQNIAAGIKALHSSVLQGDNVSGSHDSPAQIAAAQAAAAAAKAGGGGVEQARAALVAAHASLSEAVPGTVAYFNALASLYQAQQQMRNAVVQYKDTLDQLHGDLTDPVEQARDALRAAARQLAADAGAGKDVRATDELAVKQAREQVEAAAFSQRLSDIQTAEQLGNISYQTYIRYLEHESQRLHGMNNKTRQQIDEMNQIDLALKDAMNQADGFFNIGDIRTAGLVYQIRRFGSSLTGDPTGGGRGIPGSQGYQPSVVNTNSHNSVTIHGADVATVKRVLKELLGPTTPQRATQSRRV